MQQNITQNMISNQPPIRPKTFYVQRLALESKHRRSDRIVMAQDSQLSENLGSKCYLVFENFEHVLQYAKENHNLYELILPDIPTSIAYDIDFSAKLFGMQNVKKERETGAVLSLVCQLIKLDYPTLNPEIHVDTSHKNDKVSYHIRIANIAIDNFADFKAFAKARNVLLKKRLAAHLINEEFSADQLASTNIVDWNIYTKNRVFRFKGQSKYDPAKQNPTIESDQSLEDCFLQLNKKFPESHIIVPNVTIEDEEFEAI